MESNNAKNWWLYGNDQILAHELQKKQIESEINTRKVARLVSALTYIGDHRGCERLIMDKGLERFVQESHVYRTRNVFTLCARS